MNHHRVELHGTSGGLVFVALFLTFIGILALMGAAQRTGTDRRLAHWSWQLIIAAFACNAAANLWSALWPLWWAPLPLAAASAICSVIVLARYRRRKRMAA